MSENLTDRLRDTSWRSSRYPLPRAELEVWHETSRLAADEIERLQQALRTSNVDVILESEQTRLNQEVKRLNSVRLEQQRQIKQLRAENARLNDYVMDLEEKSDD